MSALSISSISSTGRSRRGEGLPQLAAPNVVGDVGHARVAELRIAQPRDGVVFVKALLGAGGRLDVPGDERRAERAGDLLREQGLAGAGLALDQERTLERDRGVDRGLQFVARDIGGGAFKAHHGLSAPSNRINWGFRLRLTRRARQFIRPLTVSISCLSEKGLGRKTKSWPSGRLRANASSA